MTGVVIPVRPGEHNPELVYALRSIAAHVPDPEVWIVGYRPSWLTGVRHIVTDPKGGKSARGCEQTRAVAFHGETPERFWWWDDDMFRLTPLTKPANWHGGPVQEWVDRFQVAGSQYAQVMRRTASLLPDNAKFWDLHVPMWLDRDQLRDTFADLPSGGWLWRTVHGNRHRLRGKSHDDVKVYRLDPIRDNGEWLSSDDTAWPRVEKWLTERFPDPSPWEASTPGPVEGVVTVDVFRWMDVRGRLRQAVKGKTVTDPAGVARGAAIGAVEVQ